MRTIEEVYQWFEENIVSSHTASWVSGYIYGQTNECWCFNGDDHTEEDQVGITEFIEWYKQ